MKKVYIYMTEDTMYTPLYSDKNTLIPFKAGYSIHPTVRGGQLKQAARRAHIEQEINMCIKRHIVEVPQNMVLMVEGYILHRIKLMPSARPLSKEFVMISIADRQYCYDHMAEWVEEALHAKAL